MNHLLLYPLSVIVALLILPCAGATNGSTDETLASFYKQYLDERLRQQPVEATRLGDHRFDAQLEDLSPASHRHSMRRR